MRETMPTSLKAALVAGFVLIGPVIVVSAWLGGVNAAAGAVVAFALYFTVLYIVGIKKYM
jgi:hypothetical protein